ncbi:hypothetical protein SmJEL517_g00958 [Synchytrium microbalum]|uniref:Alpha-aminoadipate reductase n=1 Tax=Synchytrium microbalum TaxID=1806994 RepID=A0A507C5U7_9FUNG|nr:uncharacterized protein SmJEL517_g00958 [Synchytrium microbalum]TPX36960.1 hypothetical protein SmJEL517_g00958 [Synchytrium microbalum]
MGPPNDENPSHMETVNQESLSRWRTRLANLTELILPTDFPRTIPPKIVEADLAHALGENAALALMSLSLAARQNTLSSSTSSASPFTILLAAFIVLLHKYTGEDDIAVGSSSSVANPLVLRMNVADENSFLDVVNTVLKACTEEEAAADELPFADLLNGLFDNGNAESQPSLFKVRFFDLTETTPATLQATTSSSSCDITIFVTQSPSVRRILPIELRVTYNTVLFARERMLDTLDQLEMILTAAAKDPSSPIGKITVVTERARRVTPNPIGDLGWDKFEGAIPDIFARNARAHPDRTCVVESRDSNVLSLNDLRQFTYKHIHEASNIVAHHLMRNGIQREDVVVLYSYRGVDLVVAIMGVLKAGATFSVIDPAYPSQRQTIYLSVAQPRGLVVLRKAGVLSDEVRDYAKDNLHIACEIPALELLDDGSVIGGQVNGVDILHDAQAFKSQDTGIVLGPDSVGTLSFTSGSTGIPKGVRGRHFSLTHFYPWMKQEFGLSEQERFTMLSGIAHDPIQRDIFTPLFLGAQLRIPTANDIGSPGRLAEWMAAHEITITHLTPAMGQLLSANATTAMPRLRNAFFVGDVLTKRDVLRLQHLAVNVNVINMYGTTETQRAVSYLRVPPPSTNPGFLSEQKDIMPAGKGMNDVQLLVINQSGLLCGIGEVGEIYVRSSGLAEGYLGLEDATALKFVPNPFNVDGPPITSLGKSLPFYKGPRDRMYRSGDLGRYRPDGLVECTGRADDQVKIRGFRIELGEIDTHLSQHPKVRENVTLVRRDKYEEQTLVSYFVPLVSSDDMEDLISSIREYLKIKLPSYAVPTVFVPLARMPLTPNGKVDKNALPFPDTARFGGGATAAKAANTSAEDMTPTQRAVADIWTSLLSPSTPIKTSDNFFDLGGHSIMATRLVFALRTKLALDVPLGIVYDEPTVKGMARELDRLRTTDLNLAPGALNDALSSPTLPSADRIELDYAADEDALDDTTICAGSLKFEMPDANNMTVFLTGATGFLGAFILSELLVRYPGAKVICLVRATSEEAGLARVRENGQRHLVWSESWASDGRVQIAKGDLGNSHFGLADAEWNRLVQDVDVIVHNGALVHWVYPYSKLKGPNVLGTIEALRLASSGRLKPLHFVSSTSVLDTSHYSDMLALGELIPESDALEGSRRGLRNGYGQSKWVAEKLCMRARSRGVPVTIIRPGYIMGDARTGVTNTDDFIWRLVKGCIQLGRIPRIANVVNLTSVEYVAGSVAAIAASSEALKLGNFHMWNAQRYRFDDLFGSIIQHGWQVEPTDYISWRTSLMDMTIATQDNALFPLLHFVLDDLPTSTRSAELDDKNAQHVNKSAGVVCPTMNDSIGLYYGYLVAVGFLDAPVSSGGGRAVSLPYRDEWRNLTGAVSRSGR